MKYFFLALLLLCILTVGIFGFRGDIRTSRPIEIFPDMDVQDKILGQSESAFFEDGQGSRLPVGGTVPHGLGSEIFPVEFSAGRSGYYFTGAIDDYYANGMPEELGLTADNVGGFLRRGHIQYSIHCSPCHGDAGDGKGITSYYAMQGIANLHLKDSQTLPDGNIFNVISNGKGLMGAYGDKVTVRDRWAIVAYIRALQTAMKAPAAADAAASETPPPATK
ncbi:MAG: cytochrome c [Akkermansiaceae bacterium]|nr:cytochrome c [Akkermansiaceae bacterium]